MSYRSLEELIWSNTPINRRRKNNTLAYSTTMKQDDASPLPQKSVDDILDNITTLKQLYDAIKTIPHKWNDGKTNCVTHYGEGDFMIIGEAPGQQEDIEKKPFVGASGKLLRAILQQNNLLDKDLYITNVVNFRPPNNITPDNITIKQFRNYLVKHVQLKSPKIILLCGSVALKGLMGLLSKHKITKTRGQKLYFQNILVIPTFHPAFVLRNRNSKIQEQFQQDIKDAIECFYNNQYIS